VDVLAEDEVRLDVLFPAKVVAVARPDRCEISAEDQLLRRSRCATQRGRTRRCRLRVHRDTARLHRVNVRRVVGSAAVQTEEGQSIGFERREKTLTRDVQDRVWRLGEPRAQRELCRRRQQREIRLITSSRMPEGSRRRTVRHGAADAEHSGLLAGEAGDPVLERSSRLVLVIDVVTARRLQAGCRVRCERARARASVDRLSWGSTSQPARRGTHRAAWRRYRTTRKQRRVRGRGVESGGKSADGRAGRRPEPSRLPVAHLGIVIVSAGGAEREGTSASLSWHLCLRRAHSGSRARSSQAGGRWPRRRCP
jgi:hypothetical protein